MQNFNLTKAKILLIIGLTLIGILGLLIYFFQNNSFRLSGSQPQSTNKEKVSENLKKVPTALPQEFLNTSQETGTLVVSSQLQDVRIRVGITESESSPTNKGASFPRQTPPFQLEYIPVGNYIIQAAKPGYIFKQVQVKIVKDTVTSVNINLEPIRSIEN